MKALSSGGTIAPNDTILGESIPLMTSMSEKEIQAYFDKSKGKGAAASSSANAGAKVKSSVSKVEGMSTLVPQKRRRGERLTAAREDNADHSSKEAGEEEMVKLGGSSSGEGEEEKKHPPSLWDDDFPHGQHIRQNLNFPTDLESARYFGTRAKCRIMQGLSNQMAFLALSVEDDVKVIRKDANNKINDLNLANEALKQEVCQYQKEEENFVKALAKYEKEKGRWAKVEERLEREKKELMLARDDAVDKLTLVEVQEKSADEEIARLNGKLEDAKEEVAIQFVNGFNKAVAQMQLLYPNLDLGQLGVFKDIVDGKHENIDIEQPHRVPKIDRKCRPIFLYFHEANLKQPHRVSKISKRREDDLELPVPKINKRCNDCSMTKLCQLE
ncbi:hypothetical protein CR513_16385, partial [Mucuna pruriens]